MHAFRVLPLPTPRRAVCAMLALTAMLTALIAGEVDTASASGGSDRLISGSMLGAGGWISGAQYTTYMQGDGNLVEYGNGRALWASNTSGNPGAFLAMQNDGNLVVYSRTSAPLWSSHTYGHGPSTLIMQGDGNLVVYSTSGATWADYANPPSPTSIARTVFDRVNGQRVASGRRPLLWNASLAVSAGAHNLAMSAANTLSHQLPGEAAFSTRMIAAGYAGGMFAENIAVGTDTSLNGALNLQDMMYNETAPNDGHRLNILNPQLTWLGVAVYTDTANKRWLTEDFGG
jgi:uncharacterized protein YkwD